MKLQFLSLAMCLFLLSGCGIFTKTTTDAPKDDQVEDQLQVNDKKEQPATKAANKPDVSLDKEIKVDSDLEHQIKIDKDRLIKANKVISSGDRNQCAKLEDENLRLECMDQILLKEISEDMKPTKCKELNSKDLQMICEMGFRD